MRERDIVMNNTFHDLLCHYRMALNELIAFEASDEMENRKGYLYRKKKKKKRKDKTIASYDEYYYISVDYVAGERVVHSQYVKQAEIEDYEKKLNEKKENVKRYRYLRNAVKRLAAKLRKAMRKEKIKMDLSNLKESLINHLNYRKKENTISPKITSVFGESLRSRVECIFSTLAFAFRIPYIYEPEVTLTDDRGWHEFVRPDFSFIINGKTVLVELLGMVGDKKYDARWENKARKYRESGYILGKNLICIACKDKQGINAPTLVKVLNNLKCGILPKEVVTV